MVKDMSLCILYGVRVNVDCEFLSPIGRRQIAYTA